jgi:hypothetical protein
MIVKVEINGREVRALVALDVSEEDAADETKMKKLATMKLQEALTVGDNLYYKVTPFKSFVSSLSAGRE